MLALQWRLLTAAELTKVYLNEMRRDFPPAELKPLSVILNSTASGVAHAWGVYDGEALAAYLLMVRPSGCAISQLDYFAVLPAYRASGLGAQILAELPAHEGGAQAIVIESECPEKAPDEAMARRRLGFYARCGAGDTGWTEQLFKAWFRILVMDCAEPPFTLERVLKELMLCYRSTLGEAGTKKDVHIYKPDGSLAEI